MNITLIILLLNVIKLVFIVLRTIIVKLNIHSTEFQLKPLTQLFNETAVRSIVLMGNLTCHFPYLIAI